jgi:hypothetical protein
MAGIAKLRASKTGPGVSRPKAAERATHSSFTLPQAAHRPMANTFVEQNDPTQFSSRMSGCRAWEGK